MQLFLATKAGSKIAIGSSEQTFPEARYLHAVSTKHEIKTTKFSLQWNSLDFGINRSTCKTFPVPGHVLQPPPRPGVHVVLDDNPGTQEPRDPKALLGPAAPARPPGKRGTDGRALNRKNSCQKLEGSFSHLNTMNDFSYYTLLHFLLTHSDGTKAYGLTREEVKEYEVTEEYSVNQFLAYYFINQGYYKSDALAIPIIINHIQIMTIWTAS